LVHAGRATVLSNAAEPLVLSPEQAPSHGPCVAVAGDELLWLEGGRVLRAGRFGPMGLGTVLRRRTGLFAGPTCGIVLSRAGQLRRLALFDPRTPGLSEAPWPALPRGRWLRAGAHCGPTRAWLWVLAEQSDGETLHLLVLTRSGRVVAHSRWLHGEGPCRSALDGAAATRTALLLPDATGLQRWEVDGGGVRLATTYPSTAALCPPGTRLLLSHQRLYTAGASSLRSIELAESRPPSA